MLLGGRVDVGFCLWRVGVCVDGVDDECVEGGVIIFFNC